MNERRDFSFGRRVLCIIAALHIAAAGQAWAWGDDTRFRGGLTIPPLLRAPGEASQSQIENRKSEIDFLPYGLVGADEHHAGFSRSGFDLLSAYQNLNFHGAVMPDFRTVENGIV